MDIKDINPEVTQNAITWLEGDFDDITKAEVRRMLEKDHDALTEAFYRNLEFGTGGLRGIMGVGTNRMNRYTVGMATQGLANYLKKHHNKPEPIKIAVGYDSRLNSKTFAEVTASVLSANGITVFMFDDIRPVALLSFAVRQLNCNGGIVITASHNPKEYNGYKVYWNDGAQLINPHDVNVIKEVNAISISDVLFRGNKALITLIGEETDKVYLNKVKSLSLSQESIQRQNDICIVYSPLHGSGTAIIPQALRMFGFTNVNIVAEQAQPDGNFPTVKSPNPEEKSAMAMSVELAEDLNADIVLATDPDADRVGLAIKDNNGNYVLLNGNQTASLLIYYLLNRFKEKGILTDKHYIVKTIVTTELLKAIADKTGVECFDVLTGFKYIADLIRQHENDRVFIGGGEESYGYLAGDFVRDKDAVISCCLIAETAAWAADNGLTLYNLLMNIYKEYGYYHERLISIEKKGKSGLEEIAAMMQKFRDNKPVTINGSAVILIKDYKSGIEYNPLTKAENKIKLPASDVLQWFLEDGSKITLRPSGTEPKIKFYFGMKLEPRNDFNITETSEILDNTIKDVVQEMGIR